MNTSILISLNPLESGHVFRENSQNQEETETEVSIPSNRVMSSETMTEHRFVNKAVGLNPLESGHVFRV